MPVPQLRAVLWSPRTCLTIKYSDEVFELSSSLILKTIESPISEMKQLLYMDFRRFWVIVKRRLNGR
jgi:hypothetical protein